MTTRAKFDARWTLAENLGNLFGHLQTVGEQPNGVERLEELAAYWEDRHNTAVNAAEAVQVGARVPDQLLMASMGLFLNAAAEVARKMAKAAAVHDAERAEKAPALLADQRTAVGGAA